MYTSVYLFYQQYMYYFYHKNMDDTDLSISSTCITFTTINSACTTFTTGKGYQRYTKGHTDLSLDRWCCQQGQRKHSPSSPYLTYKVVARIRDVVLAVQGLRQRVWGVDARPHGGVGCQGNCFFNLPQKLNTSTETQCPK